MKKELALLSKFNKNKALNIINNTVLIKDNHIIATDLEAYVSIPTTISGTGVFDLNEIKKVLTKYPDADIQIIGDKLVVSQGSKTFRFSSMDADDYPKVPKSKNTIGTVIVDKEFLNMKHFTGSDEIRVAMTGLNFNGNVLEATDAYALRTLKGRVEFHSPDTTFIAPKGVFNMPINRYSISDCEDGFVEFMSIDGVTFTFRKIDARFPDCKVVVPDWDSYPIQVRIPTAELAALLEDCLMAANSTTHRVVLDTAKCELHAEDVDLGREFTGKYVFSTQAGGDIEIAFNAELMLKRCLLDAPTITEIRMMAPNKVLLINETTLMMPMMMN